MKISGLKQHLDQITSLNFLKPDGTSIPAHFHITEAGLTSKHFVDCGGKVRMDKTLNFQIWTANDYDHRLDPGKLKKIIGISQNLFGNDDHEVEIEYQSETIGRYALNFEEGNFKLVPKHTACLAADDCGVPKTLEKAQTSAACCTPGGACC